MKAPWDPKLFTFTPKSYWLHTVALLSVLLLSTNVFEAHASFHSKAPIWNWLVDWRWSLIIWMIWEDRSGKLGGNRSLTATSRFPGKLRSLRTLHQGHHRFLLLDLAWFGRLYLSNHFFTCKRSDIFHFWDYDVKAYQLNSSSMVPVTQVELQQCSLSTKEILVTGQRFTRHNQSHFIPTTVCSLWEVHSTFHKKYWTIRPTSCKPVNIISIYCISIVHLLFRLLFCQ